VTSPWERRGLGEQGNRKKNDGTVFLRPRRRKEPELLGGEILHVPEDRYGLGTGWEGCMRPFGAARVDIEGESGDGGEGDKEWGGHGGKVEAKNGENAGWLSYEGIQKAASYSRQSKFQV
jgi:hypothetical protein